MLLAAALGACRETDEHSYISAVVWSDDGERVAYAVQHFEVSHPRGDPRDTENGGYHFEVWTTSLDGAERLQWRHRDGSVGLVHDMRSAGYLLVEHNAEDDHGCELLRAPDEPALVWNSGGHDEVCDGCELSAMLPSPTGALLAVRYDASPRGEPPTVALAIVDAQDGAEVWGPKILDRRAGRAAWISDDELLLDREGGTSWRWRRDREDLEMLDRPGCSTSLVPATTSSPIHADGRLICGTEDPDEPVEVCECQDPGFDHDLNWCYQGVPFGECPGG